MKKNLVFITATEAGILVGVKTKLSEKDLKKIEHNEERVNNLLKDVHAEIIQKNYSMDGFNFCIGSLSSGEVSIEALHVECSNMMSAMEQFKGWLKTVPEVEEKKDLEPTQDEKERPTEDIMDSVCEGILKERPECAYLVMIADPNSHEMHMRGNINKKIAAMLLYSHYLEDELRNADEDS